jgi:hypothetical protein
MASIKCPRCGSGEVRALGPDWFECIGQVPISGALPAQTGLPHPILTFGPCRNRWSQSAVEADAKDRAQRARADARAEAGAKAAHEAARLAAIDLLASARSPIDALRTLRSFDAALPSALLRDLWLRFLGDGSFRPSGDMVTLEGRQTVFGYFLSRGTMTSQWGHWKERDREPVFLAAGAGHEVIPARGEEWETTYEGFDVWFDSEGTLWSDGRSTSDRVASLAVGREGHRSTAQLVVGPGEAPLLRRRKAKWMGWEIRVPNARGAAPYSPDDLAYTRAMTAVLDAQVSMSGQWPP